MHHLWMSSDVFCLRKMKGNSTKYVITTRMIKRVSCTMYLLSFVVFLSVHGVSNGYSTNRSGTQLRDDAREFNLETQGTTSSSFYRKPETTTSPRHKIADPSRTSSPNVTPKWLTSLSKLAGLDECGKSNVNLTDRIVGGHPAELGAWPWVAVLWYKSKAVWKCAGTLISKRHVLTAAHCVSEDLYMVRLGELNLDPNVADGASPVDYNIAEKIVHPYIIIDGDIHSHDIAILRLEKDVTFTDLIQPICLPSAPEISNNTWVNSLSTVVGWGRTGNESESKALMEVQLPVWDNKNCNSTYAQAEPQFPDIDDRWLCASPQEGGKGACYGDSGGPIMISHDKRFYQIGVVAWAYKCWEAKYPTVFARVSYYMEWIAENTR